MYKQVKVGDRVKICGTRDGFGETNYFDNGFVGRIATVTLVKSAKVTFPGFHKSLDAGFDVVHLVLDDGTVPGTWWRSDDLEVIRDNEPAIEEKQERPVVGDAIVVTTERYLPGLKPGACKYVTEVCKDNPYNVYVTVFSTEFNTDFEIPLDVEDYYQI